MKRIITLLTFLFLFSSVGFVSAGSQVHDTGLVISSGSNIQGAKASITYNSKPYVSGQDFSTAWSMIESSTYGTVAQCGWDLDLSRNTAVRYFYGWINTDLIYREVQATTGPALGSTHTYKVQWNPTTGTAEGYVDTAFAGSSTLDWTPNAVEYGGEVGNSSYSQLPGKTSLKETLSSILYYNGGTGTWIKPGLNVWNDQTVNPVAGQDHSQYSSSGYFTIWDTRY